MIGIRVGIVKIIDPIFPTPYSLLPIPCSLFPTPFPIVISVINTNGVATIPTQLW
ncbi:MAG: hypothetical protein F6J94_29675 [Moorea sp. SIO1F2]|uniref:hypothetical protein n=1 Tax=unclassified Moorena TaxID=2683338 RepID=UPI0013B6E4BF|nr:MULTISPECIES: hypothetical protein [unclassified Moorena]NEO13701.1 hypothetical protein [Moorena sp. SIO3E8]NEP98367.1 hypothetical protein [Moorena sp. SIO3F7]NET85908.1 hypothetical protein [Moorena sp. SIO1F2]